MFQFRVNRYSGTWLVYDEVSIMAEVTRVLFTAALAVISIILLSGYSATVVDSALPTPDTANSRNSGSRY